MALSAIYKLCLAFIVCKQAAFMLQVKVMRVKCSVNKNVSKNYEFVYSGAGVTSTGQPGSRFLTTLSLA